MSSYSYSDERMHLITTLQNIKSQFTDLGQNGAGACMEGGVRGPASGVCQPGRNISFGDDKAGLSALPDPDTFALMQVLGH